MQNIYRLKQARRWLMAVLSGLLLVALLTVGGTALAQDLPPNSAGVAVQSEVLQTLQEEGSADFILVMAEQADLSAAYQMDWETRGWYVYNTLKETAERSQAPVIAALEAAGVRYQSFIAGNEIYVYDGSRAVLNRALWAGEIQEVRAPVEITLAAPRFELVQPGPVPQNSIQETAWGITDTRAPDFWAQFGLRGEGVRVASIDTGAQWDHPALREAYACKDNPSSSICWRDPTNVCTAGLPCDDQGHGTHTIGTMVGSDNPALPYQVGMAPGAQWIACKGCAGTNCSGVHLAACADWLLAPGGNPANRPQVVNNSWGGPGGNLWFTIKVNNWRAAGILPVFAAGNTGQQGCSTLNSPADYAGSFAVAAHDSYGVIGNFSSRGPSTIGSQPYTKPNLSAPGVAIRSAVPNQNVWESWSGTSMAAPHVAGAAALLYACAPALRGNMTATFELLQQTADPPIFSGSCGTPDGGLSNYTYGYGYLNVLRAGQVICPIGQVQGTVRALSTSQPIPNSVVFLNWIGNPWQLTTDSAGFFQKTSLVAQTYQVIASADGYCSASQQVSIQNGSTATVNLSLIECPNRLFLPAINR
ncbi:MAG: S8 family serine peptidase [Chloroflexota bacterium]